MSDHTSASGLEPGERALLERVAPGLGDGGPVVREGQFHRVVVGPDRVVCLPRTRAAAVRLPRRAAVLRVLAGLDLGFRTPLPLSEGTGEPPYLVLTRVPGAPLEPYEVADPRVADAAAAQYAALLAGLAAAGADERARAALSAPRDQWRRFAAEVRADLFALMSPDGRRRAERELAALDDLPYVAEAVVHGDLGPENVLWEYEDGLPRLAGVIDWDEVTIGDPAEDLAALEAGYGGDFLARVLARTASADAALAARVTAIRHTFALQQALSAHHDGDAEELADGLTGYR
ncbi:phosphotransferase [Nonomuraea sp. WAC 01424]|uniref:phosphotransferase family protein n=1 Tax=Nonomuraea sp. WAC 01424 TaxID=2203200 RepID=UPI000F7AFAC5|nr:aminoglycoside phosphotransferase family protein [Nonomuraea sp. WAC 01424]RSN09352.1 phosphotransferase [Nonomuraea sp. WAC 01424]